MYVVLITLKCTCKQTLLVIVSFRGRELTEGVVRGLDVGSDTASLGGEDPTLSTNFPLLSAFFDLVVVFLHLAGGFSAASADLFFLVV